ncbi:MAG TPA: mechanosensitive ion channel domain-containing protein [Stellaceae bacterium]|jgi:small-conductance mechanosensitive channel|nr:mechanosensitive ion channel domain-containing protein [Stellaceae bacterium]
MPSISKAILFLWLVLWPAAALAQAPSSGAISAAEAQRTLDILQDPAKRAQLIETLQTIAKAQHANPSEPALAPDSLGAQLLAQSSRWADRLADAAATAIASMIAFPSLLRSLRQYLADPDELARLGQNVWRIVLVLLLALVVEWLALRGLRRPLAAIGAHAPDREPEPASLPPEALPDPAEVSPPVVDRLLAERQRSARTRRHLRRLPYALGWLGLELLPVVLFAAAGTILSGSLITNPTARLVTLSLVNAYAIGRAIICVARMLLAPHQRGLRLLPVGDGAAAYLLRWLRTLVVIALFGNALAEIVFLLGADQGAHDTLVRLTALVVALLLIAVVVELRGAVARRLRPTGEEGAAWRHWLAGAWHYLAILVIVFGWLAWTLGSRNGGGLRLLVGTAAVLIAARLSAILILGGIDWSVRLIPAVETRGARYRRPVRLAVTTVLFVATAVVLLQLWGAHAFAWFAGQGFGARVLSALVTIVVAVGVGVVIWEVANAALGRHLNRLAEQQEAKSARLRTLLPMLRAALLTTILIIVGMTVLSEIGINIAPLLAGAGVLGVAIGFGSQKLVQDVITGMFVLFEDAIQIGDLVTVAGLSGTVEQLSVRNLWLRAADGAVHIVPFSAVSTITNSDRGVGNAVVSVTVAYKEDTDRVAAAIEEVGAELRRDPNYARLTVSDFQLWGVDAVKASGVTVTGQIVCTDAGRLPVQREFNRRLKQRFEALGIELSG